MTIEQTELLQGTLDLAILKALDGEEMHGFDVSRRIEQITKGAYEFSAGSLYVALHRMEDAGWLASFWGESAPNRQAKYYRLTTAGRRQLSVESKRPARISLSDVLDTVTAHAELALDNSRLASSLLQESAERERINREMDIVREVQQNLLPRGGPSVPGIEYAGACRPAMAVGGDYYDFLPLADGRFGFAIGDVSGKGFAAALLMASLRASLRGVTLDAPDNLAAVMGRINKLLFEATVEDRYATFFYAQYDPASRKLTWVNAGHNSPLLFRGGQIRKLEEGGPVIGLFPELQYEQASVELVTGDLVIACTDGVTEAMNPNDEEWGEARLRAAIGAYNHGLPIAKMIDRLFACADAHAAGAAQHDDMTLVAVRAVPLA